MRSRSLEIRFATVLLTGIMCAGFVVSGAADVIMKCTTGRHEMRATTRVPGPSVNDVVDGTNDGVIDWEGRDEGGNPDSTCFYCSDETPSFSHRVYASACCGPEDEESMYVYAIGEGSSGGGLHTSSFPGDTTFAGVGIYPNPDSALRVQVDRTVVPGLAPDVVTLTFLGGGLQTRTNGESQQSSVTLKMIVYPTLAAANADPTLSGSGSAFFGAVTLAGGTGSLLPVQGFSLDNFLLESVGAGQFTARLVPGTMKVASVPDANAAVFVLLGDPKSGSNQVLSNSSGDTPRALAFAPIKPNPFAGDVAFRFSLPHRGPVSLEVFDLLGRRVRSWRWVDLPAGEHSVHWDGRTLAGSRAQAGALLVRLTALGRTITRKAMQLP